MLVGEVLLALGLLFALWPDLPARASWWLRSGGPMMPSRPHHSNELSIRIMGVVLAGAGLLLIMGA